MATTETVKAKRKRRTQEGDIAWQKHHDFLKLYRKRNTSGGNNRAVEAAANKKWSEDMEGGKSAAGLANLKQFMAPKLSEKKPITANFLRRQVFNPLARLHFMAVVIK